MIEKIITSYRQGSGISGSGLKVKAKPMIQFFVFAERPITLVYEEFGMFFGPADFSPFRLIYLCSGFSDGIITRLVMVCNLDLLKKK